MQKTDSTQVTVTRRRVQSSTTLNRKYARKPVIDSAVRLNSTKRLADAKPECSSQVANNVRVRMQARSASPAYAKKATAAELKEQAIRKALAGANEISQVEPEASRVSGAIQNSATKEKKVKKGFNMNTEKLRFGVGRVLLALGCAAVAVLAIVYFVNVNMPDISLKVAAMQTGIENPYPSYVPRDYGVSDVLSENGKVTLNFKNSVSGGEFTLTEERSSWDSNALLVNYVKDAYGDNHTVIREQGLTLYISGSDAAWVNGGIVYKIKTISGSLTKKQLKAISTSF